MIKQSAYAYIFAHELKQLKDSGRMSAYEALRPALLETGILDFLRLTAGPFVPGLGADVQEAAHAASFAEGYNKCINDLKYFSVIHDSVEVKKAPIVADYGGVKMAIQKGDIVKDGYQDFSKSKPGTTSKK